MFIKDQLTLLIPPNLHGLVPDAYYIIEFQYDAPVAYFPGNSNFWLSWRLRGPAGDQARIRFKAPAIHPKRSVVIGAAGDTTIARDFVATALGLARQDSVDLWGEVHVCYPNGYPVELTSFAAAYKDGKAQLSWRTATEVNNYGFDIERLAVSSEETGMNVWQRIGFVNGHGSTTLAQSYSYVDPYPEDAVQEGGAVRYRLRQIDFDGATDLSHVAEIHIPLSTGFTMEQNFPNPASVARGSSTVAFQLSKDGPVRLELYDALGRSIRTLLNGVATAGRHFIDVPLAGMRSGTYFYRLTADGHEMTRHMIVTE
jgi:hypothetical protein